MKPARFSVQWMEQSLRDVEAIAAHLADEAPLDAGRLLDRLIDKGDSLSRLPARGRVVPELRDLGEQSWREVQQPPWRILYRVVGRAVELHAVLDSRRDLEDVLRERLLASR